MSLLLDTHTILWLAEGNPALTRLAMSLISDPKNKLYVSMASVWEVAIKIGLKKLRLLLPLQPFIEGVVLRYRLTMLPITLDDCSAYESLGFPNAHHRDPFDRILIAQALRLSFAILGCDATFDAYGITRHW